MSERTDRAGRPGDRTRAEATTSRWEWIVTVISTLLVVGAVGYVLYRAVSEPTTPPEIVVTIEDIHPRANGYLVEFWAYNRGGRTAKDLAIEGRLVSDTGVVATRSTSLTFVPGESKRRGGLFFPVDPRRYRIEMYPVGYDVP